jgi:hypothetical protein
MPMKSSSSAAAPIPKNASWAYEEAATAETVIVLYAAKGNRTLNSQSSRTGLYSVCVRRRRATMAEYVVPLSPTKANRTATVPIPCHGALTIADSNSTAEK